MLTDHLPHGDGLVAFGFLKSLAERGWRLHVATERVALRTPLPANITVYPIAPSVKPEFLRRLVYMARARLLFRKLRRAHDIGLVHQMNPVYAGLSLAMIGCGLPVVLGTYVARWPYQTSAGPARPPMRERVAGVLRWIITFPQQLAASALLVTTQAARNRIAAPRLFAKKIVTIRHGLDTAKFSPPAGWQDDMLARTTPSILFYSQVDPRKGIHVLLDAYREVLKDLPDCRLTIAGRGSEIEAVRARIATFERPNQVDLLGPVDRAEAPALFQSHSVYCLPSFGEPYATTVIEAMSCARALVVTDAGGIPDMFPPEGGLRVKVGNPKALADALLRVLQSPALQVSMGEANRAYATRHYAWSGVIDALEQVYLRLASGR
jgi:glycosyltransferase involved in cell wall biosynthesis